MKKNTKEPIKLSAWEGWIAGKGRNLECRMMVHEGPVILEPCGPYLVRGKEYHVQLVALDMASIKRTEAPKLSATWIKTDKYPTLESVWTAVRTHRLFSNGERKVLESTKARLLIGDILHVTCFGKAQSWAGNSIMESALNVAAEKLGLKMVVWLERSGTLHPKAGVQHPDASPATLNSATTLKDAYGRPLRLKPTVTIRKVKKGSK